MRGLSQFVGGLLFVIVLAAAPGSCACNETKKSTTATPGTVADAGAAQMDPKACDDLKPTITALYRTASKQGDKGADEAIADNTAMILRDCRTNAAKFAPCIKAAADVATLERDCIIPLDDEGRVEGKAFGGK